MTLRRRKLRRTWKLQGSWILEPLTPRPRKLRRPCPVFCRLDLASRSTQARRASTRLDRLSLDELLRGSIESASTSFGKARSTQPRRALARLDRGSLDELQCGSVEPASTSSGEARTTRPRRASSRLDRANRRPLIALDQQGFDGPRCSKTFSLSIMSCSFVT